MVVYILNANPATLIGFPVSWSTFWIFNVPYCLFVIVIFDVFGAVTVVEFVLSVCKSKLYPYGAPISVTV